MKLKLTLLAVIAIAVITAFLFWIYRTTGILHCREEPKSIRNYVNGRCYCLRNFNFSNDDK